MIGIIVADENEIVKDFKKLEQKTINSFKFYISKEYVVVHSKVGITQAAAATQSLIDNFDISKILNFGAVGATEGNVFDIVIPERIYYHDVKTPWYKRGQVPGFPEYYLNSHPNAKINYYLASGMEFVQSKEVVDNILKDINDIKYFDMECAAIAQIAKNNNKELIVIKVISDIIGKNDFKKLDINTLITKAAEQAWLEIKTYFNFQ